MKRYEFTPRAARSRWYATVTPDGLGILMRHDATRYVVRAVATCRSQNAAEKLARALNREEKYARWRREDLERNADACRIADERGAALRELIGAIDAKACRLRSRTAWLRACSVLEREPTFAPGGEEVCGPKLEKV